MAEGRKNLMVGNWKMNATHLEAIQMVQKLSYRLDPKDFDRIEVVVCPPFTALRSVQTVIEADRLMLRLGAQHVHWEEQGAFTGEVSVPMLAKLAVSHVICGHSERRQHFGETNETVNRRTRAILRNGLTPIVCVGETLEERESERTEEVVVSQLDGGLAALKADELEKVVIAYEPVWAIGTGRNATPDDAGAVCEVIRTRLGERAQAEGIPILYGGSVNAGNIKALMAKRHIDGALVGGASLDPDGFASICRYWL
ncbi:MAG TPA: triose-phosphate isomerase [Acidimicrobiia bacterium]|jgi:triosephosphate isomerase|nr:triose-phosphate isomerase [Acidimicrobiia bacterium]